jgi:hypothetical protein
MGKSQNIPKDNFEVKNGRNSFAKGNTIGRMKKKGYTINDLTNVVMEYEKTHNNTVLKHYIEQLFNNNKLLDKFIDRYIPPVLKQEVDVDGELKLTAGLDEKLSQLTVQELKNLANSKAGKSK